jgi:NADH-quinone oxidoreductase subunit N
VKLIAPQELVYLLPELILVGTLIWGLVVELLIRDRRTGSRAVAGFVLLGLVAALAADLRLLGGPGQSLMSGMIVLDDFAIVLQVLAALAAALTVFISLFTREVSVEPTAGRGEYYLLLLGATVGMFFLVSATNLLMLYLAMELLSLPSYLLVAWPKRSRRATEAGIKYVVYGAGASCSMIYGISLLYGLSGSLALTDLHGFAAGLSAAPALPKAAFLVALLLTLAGFFFKVAAFPLFQWAPDVYEGAPTPITAFLAVGSKAVGMGALLRFIYLGLCSRGAGEVFVALSGVNWPLLLALISACTMTVGNLVALVQTNTKRMLAYSSIAHAGYILMAIPVLSLAGLSAALFYLAVYLVMNLGAFLSVIELENRGLAAEIKNYRGLGARAPYLAIVFSVFLFSLTGLPPLAGFIGKFYLFAALIKGGLYWLAVVGVLNSVVSLYYYAGVVRRMFLEKPLEETPLPGGSVLPAVLGVLAALTLVLGLYWAPLSEVMRLAAGSLLSF